MRAALWFVALFGVAVAIALFAGNNQSTITLYWPPYRLDLSLNLVLLLLGLGFLLLHVALRTLATLFAMPDRARRWRLLHQERAMHMALLDALAHLIAGRYIRARKGAESVLARVQAMTTGGEAPSYAGRLTVLAHLLAAESAQVLQDRAAREEHFALALGFAAQRDAQDTRDALQLRAARWALEDREAGRALQWLDDLPQGAARRTIALRLRLKAARLVGHTRQSLETARLLAKHRAFSALAAHSLLQGLAREMVQGAHDPEQMQAVWSQLDPAERDMPDVAIAAAQRLQSLGGEVALARQWLEPMWERMVDASPSLTEAQRLGVIRALEQGFALSDGAPQAHWLQRIEQARAQQPGDAALQYLAGITCLRLQLWGKAQQLLRQALPRLTAPALQREAWLALAELAEQRGDAASAAQAWREAAKT